MNDPSVFRLRFVWLLLVFAALAATGCAIASVPSHGLPLPQVEANRLNERGIDAVNDGKPSLALDAFAGAYRAYAAIEYHPGMVTALINTARVATGQGKTDIAQQALDNALKLLSFTPGLTMEVFFEQSRLLLRRGNLPEAGQWSERALAECGGKTRGRILNQLAEIRLKEGKTEIAKSLAGTALDSAQNVEDFREVANASRLLGEIAFTLRRLAEAETNFSNALAYDKKLGLSAKIGSDLQWLARTAETAGQNGRAWEYWERAGSVSLGAGDRESGIACLERLAHLYQQAGERLAEASVRRQIRILRSVPR